jgi:hypothetical protein
MNLIQEQQIEILKFLLTSTLNIGDSASKIAREWVMTEGSNFNDKFDSLIRKPELFSAKNILNDFYNDPIEFDESEWFLISKLINHYNNYLSTSPGFSDSYELRKSYLHRFKRYIDIWSKTPGETFDLKWYNFILSFENMSIRTMILNYEAIFHAYYDEEKRRIDEENARHAEFVTTIYRELNPENENQYDRRMYSHNNSETKVLGNIGLSNKIKEFFQNNDKGGKISKRKISKRKINKKKISKRKISKRKISKRKKK